MCLRGEGLVSLAEKMESWESVESSSGAMKRVDRSSTPAEQATVGADSQRKPGANTLIQERPQAHRILIVEDDLSLSQFLCSELETRSYKVEQAHDGEEAISCLESKRKYDLLVLDLNLPKVDGLELLRQVRPVQIGRASCRERV